MVERDEENETQRFENSFRISNHRVSLKALLAQLDCNQNLTSCENI